MEPEDKNQKLRRMEENHRLSSTLQVYDKILSMYSEKLNEHPYSNLNFRKHFINSFNIRYQLKFWTSPYIKDFLKVPNTLKQDLQGAEEILSEIQKLDNETILAIAKANQLNYSRMKKRYVLNWFSKAGISLTGLIGMIVSIQKLYDININDYIPSEIVEFGLLLLGSLLLGFVIGALINIIISIPRISLIKNLDDIISIAKAYRKI